MFKKTYDRAEIKRRHDIASNAAIILIAGLMALPLAFCSPHGTAKVVWLVLDIFTIIISTSICALMLATVPSQQPDGW